MITTIHLAVLEHIKMRGVDRGDLWIGYYNLGRHSRFKEIVEESSCFAIIKIPSKFYFMYIP